MQVFGQRTLIVDLGLPIMSKMAVIFSGSKATMIVVVGCCCCSCPQLTQVFSRRFQWQQKVLVWLVVVAVIH
jgi:hypothetical protein